MEQLRISLVQAILHWEDGAKNLAMFSEKISGLKGKTDLVILPEMFTSGFSMNAANISEAMDGDAVNWMREQAEKLDCALTGSIAIQENERYYNRLIFMLPNGEYHTYDKRHLFTLAKEQLTYSPGQDRLVVEYLGWKICPLICYDLRFPVWSRNTEDFDLLIYVANWPETRSFHWLSLLKARAIENQCYTIGVNRVGEDGKGFVYSGDTSLMDFYGKTLYSSSKVEDILTTTISNTAQAQYRSKLDFLPDRDSFQIL